MVESQKRTKAVSKNTTINKSKRAKITLGEKINALNSTEIVTPWSTVGLLTYKRTYSRKFNENDPDTAATEEFPDTINRVLSACQEQLKTNFSDAELERLRRYFLELKCSVAGRFLWQLGTKTVDRIGLASLQNCAFTVVDSPIVPFTWCMDMLALGSGVGYNLQKKNVDKLPEVREWFKAPTRVDNGGADFIIPDSREGWVRFLAKTLKAAFLSERKEKGTFTYSTQVIRGKGAPIKGFGGVASGPEDLVWGIGKISEILIARSGRKVRPIDVLDIMNIIGHIIVAGNVRRSAQIAIGDCDDIEFLLAKRWDFGNIPSWRAMSNNSVVCDDIRDLHEYFWHGYEGKGEAYGLINLKLSRKAGRLGETQYPDPEVQGFNPCAEQSLAPYETCVSYDTRIQTRKGAVKIGSVVGQEVEVWNGEGWSKTVPFLAKENDLVFRVTFSDGSILDANADHEFSVKLNKSKTTKRVKLLDLLPGQHYLPKFELGEVTGDYDSRAYLLGAFMGDGYVDAGKAIIATPESKYPLIEHYGDSVLAVYKEQKREGLEAMSRVVVDIETDIAIALRDRNEGIPDFIMNFDKSASIEFVAGVIDTDGSIRETNGVQSYAIWSTSIKKLQDLQLLMRRAGINSTSIILDISKENKGNFGRNYDLYKLSIHSFDCEAIPTKLKVATSFGTRYKTNNAYPNGALVDSAKAVRVENIEVLGEMAVYCFSEPIRQMGVFGNVLTHQCCLAEVFLSNVESAEELKDICTLLYRINKHSLLLPAHHPETDAIVHKNMRMGIGMTGIMQATKEQVSWLHDTYEHLRDYDGRYSQLHGYNKSIKLTTVKPSGTLSLLPGVTPGIHPGYAQYMYRRIRIAAGHALVQVCKDHGYPVEYARNFHFSEDYNTVVVTFPFAYPEGTRLAAQMTAIDQLKEIKKMQELWSDNAVSCTVYYRKEELPEIKEYLAKHYKNNYKSLSFLLHSEHGFQQAPYEEVTKEEYEDLVSKTRIITSVAAAAFEGGDECAGGMCPVR